MQCCPVDIETCFPSERRQMMGRFSGLLNRLSVRPAHPRAIPKGAYRVISWWKEVCCKLSLHHHNQHHHSQSWWASAGFNPRLMLTRADDRLKPVTSPLRVWFWRFRSDPSLSAWSRLRCWCTGALTGRHARKPCRTPADARNPAASSFTTATAWRWSTERRVRKRNAIVFSITSPLVFIKSGIGVRHKPWICSGRHVRRWNQLYKQRFFKIFNLVSFLDEGHVCLITT